MLAPCLPGMKSLGFIVLAVLAGTLFSAATEAQDQLDHRPPTIVDEEFVLDRLALGSCCQQSKPVPTTDLIGKSNADLFLWLGDNIYGDTNDMQVLVDKYQQLADRSEYQRLVEAMPVIATWDDHDFGVNDGGREYPHKIASKNVMLDFFDEPTDSQRRERSGIYTSYLLGPAEKQVHIILPDLRTFRSKVPTRKEVPYKNMGHYREDTEGEMLGDEQWEWLEEQLQVDSRIKIIGMSTQFVQHGNGFEAWANMPRQQKKLVDLIRKYKTEGVLFVSGDTHWTEVSCLESDGVYPLFDFTASSLNQHWEPAANTVRVGPAYGHPNYSLLNIDWEQSDPLIQFQSFDIENKKQVDISIRLGQLTFDDSNLNLSPLENIEGAWESSEGKIEFIQDEEKMEWIARYSGGSCRLTRNGDRLSGTWTETGKTEPSGTCSFALYRDSRFVRGTYSLGMEKAEILAWPCWNKRGDDE